MNALAFLAQEAPGFALRGSQVKVITEPSSFYHELYKRAAVARKRITLSALYLGTGKQEQNLISAIHKNLVSRSGVKVKVLLDFCRGNRVNGGQSSCTLLQKLIAEDKDSCQISMYHTPALRGIWKKIMPQRYNEMVGLQHCKVYIFDDSLIISGANLSQDYFTNRQDRYLLFESCPKLADFFDELVSSISEFSLRMDEKREFAMSERWKIHPFRGNYRDFTRKAHEKMTNFIESQRVKNRLSFESISGGFSEGGGGGDADANKCDTWIFPTIQMGLFDVHQDRKVTTRLLESGEAGSTFKFGTGYFNLTQEYLHVILHGSMSNFDLLMAHPTANGFFGARGPAGGITHAYTLISRQFYQLISKSDDHDRVRMFEYQRPGWTFHGKGLWYYPPSSSTTLPIATMVGSPNFGHRSVERDLEAQVTVVTKCKELQVELNNEQQRLFECSSRVNQTAFEEEARRVPRWVKFVVAVARNFF